MSDHAIQNEAFLRNIYARGPFSGHGFCVHATGVPLHEWEGYDYPLSDAPVSEWVPWVVENYERQVRMLEAVGDDSVPVAKLGTGTQIYAAAFGCRVHRYDDTNPAALPLVRTAEEADEIEAPDIWRSRELSRVFELGSLVRDELGEDAYLGPCDVQSGFDTASLIWNKEHFLMAMMEPDDSAAAKRLVDKCASLLKTFLAELRREFPRLSPCHCPAAWAPPEMGPWLSNDECGIMGTAMFEEHALPELIDLSEHFGGLGMHCCADAEHQFASFNAIPNFYAFNRVLARSGWDPILDHFSGPEAPAHVLSWITDEAALKLMDDAAEGTRFIFVLDTADPEQGKAWYEKMRALSPRTDLIPYTEPVDE